MQNSSSRNIALLTPVAAAAARLLTEYVRAAAARTGKPVLATGPKIIDFSLTGNFAITSNIEILIKMS